MSDQVSAIETEDEDKAATYLRELQAKAGFSEQDVAEGRPVWEVIKKGFRSPLVSTWQLFDSHQILTRPVDQQGFSELGSHSRQREEEVEEKDYTCSAC